MKDILSNTTLKIRKLLKFSSFVGLTFWYLGFKIDKISISGYISEISHPERIPILIIIVIIYFLTIFIYYTLNDFRKFNYQSNLKPFEDRINVHLSGMNEGDRTNTIEAIKGILSEESYVKNVNSINTINKRKFYVDVIIPIALAIWSIIMLIICYIN